MKPNNYLVIPFISVIIVAFIFLVAQIPSANVKPENLPVALVNEDASEMSQTIVKTLKEKAPEAIQFIEYNSVKEMEEAMDSRETYGGLVFPKAFSSELASLTTEKPEAAKLQIYINEGANSTVATSLEGILTTITKQINSQVSAQIIEQIGVGNEKMIAEITKQLEAVVPPQVSEELSKAISPVKPELVTLLANPIETEVIKVNAVGKLGAVPTTLFVPIWIASILGAAFLYLAGNKRIFENVKSRLQFRIIQSLLPIVFGLFTGYLVTWYSTWILGFEYESFNKIALFLSIAVIAYVYMILGITIWLKIGVLPIFVLFIFFGLPLIQLIPEMIPSFYADYILPWLPIRFVVGGLKEILFFGQGIFNDNSMILIWIAVGGFVLIWLKNFFGQSNLEK